MPAIAPDVEAFVDENPIDPAEETVPWVVAVERCECVTKHGLRDILCVLHVAEHAESDVEHTAVIAIHQLVPRRPLAV